MVDERSRYNKIVKLLGPLVGQEIHLDKLWRRVMIDIGSTEEVITSTIRLMSGLGLIVEVRPYIYKVLRNEADI